MHRLAHIVSQGIVGSKLAHPIAHWWKDTIISRPAISSCSIPSNRPPTASNKSQHYPPPPTSTRQTRSSTYWKFNLNTNIVSACGCVFGVYVQRLAHDQHMAPFKICWTCSCLTQPPSAPVYKLRNSTHCQTLFSMYNIRWAIHCHASDIRHMYTEARQGVFSGIVEAGGDSSWHGSYLLLYYNRKPDENYLTGVFWVREGESARPAGQLAGCVRMGTYQSKQCGVMTTGVYLKLRAHQEIRLQRRTTEDIKRYSTHAECVSVLLAAAVIRSRTQ